MVSPLERCKNFDVKISLDTHELHSIFTPKFTHNNPISHDLWSRKLANQEAAHAQNECSKDGCPVKLGKLQSELYACGSI